MKRHIFPLYLACLFLAACSADPAPASAPSISGPPPNILLIVADDLGWADINCYGNPLVQSPHLDQLARTGIQFMQAYAGAPTGRPSRAALQTGLHPARTGSKGLSENFETLGELAHKAGLKTAHIGKWQLGEQTNGPENQGYDHVFAVAEASPDSYYYPFFKDHPVADLLTESQEGDYLTDKLTDHAINLVENWQDSSWLLSLNYYTPHVPLEGRKDQVKAYRALVDSTHWRTFPSLEYAAMISVLDENIGRLVASLRATGQLDHTLIIFTSDNGGLHLEHQNPALADHTPPTDNGILRGGKGTLYEGGIRVPFIVHYPAYAMTTQATTEQVVGMDVFPTIGAVLGQEDYAATPDGRSLLPILGGNAPGRLRTLHWEAPHGHTAGPTVAVRRGDYKLHVDEERDSLTYFQVSALPDESLPMAAPPEEDLIKALRKARKKVGWKQ
ncbi:MAG: sulfatase-like hydrolase/transferase [Bacteroidota bacterium]